MNLFKKFRNLVICVLCFNLLCVTALAAPKTMADGGTFDAEYYTAQNPDVVASLGSDEATLYNHYLNFGKAEGRLPYEGYVETNSSSTTKSSKTSSTTTISNNTSVSSSTTTNNTEATVYITKTGTKYHTSNCRTLKKSKIAISSLKA